MDNTSNRRFGRPSQSVLAQVSLGCFALSTPQISIRGTFKRFRSSSVGYLLIWPGYVLVLVLSEIWNNVYDSFSMIF